MEKFGGIGLKNIMVVWLLVCCLTVMAKTVFTLYEIPGVSEFFRSV